MSSDNTRLTCEYVAPEPADPRFDYDSLVDPTLSLYLPFELPDEEEEVHVVQEHTRCRCDDPEYDWIPAPEWFPHTRSRCDDPEKYDWVPRTWSLVEDTPASTTACQDHDWFPHTWSRCDDSDDQASVPLPNTVEELYKQVNMDIDAAINQYDMDVECGEDAQGNGCFTCGIACETSYCSEQCWLDSDECKDTCGRTFADANAYTCGLCEVDFTYPEFQYYEYDYEYRGLDGEIDPDVGKNVYVCHDCFCENSTAQRTHNQNFPLTDYPWQHHPVLSAMTAFQHLRIYNQVGDLQMWADVYQFLREPRLSAQGARRSHRGCESTP